jgi:hypothetical protein
MEKTDTGWLLRCECKAPGCTAAFEVETFPDQDIALISLMEDDRIKESIPMRLIELKTALNT